MNHGHRPRIRLATALTMMAILLCLVGLACSPVAASQGERSLVDLGIPSPDGQTDALPRPDLLFESCASPTTPRAVSTDGGHPPLSRPALIDPLAGARRPPTVFETRRIGGPCLPIPLLC